MNVDAPAHAHAPPPAIPPRPRPSREDASAASLFLAPARTFAPAGFDLEEPPSPPPATFAAPVAATLATAALAASSPPPPSPPPPSPPPLVGGHTVAPEPLPRVAHHLRLRKLGEAPPRTEASAHRTRRLVFGLALHAAALAPTAFAAAHAAAPSAPSPPPSEVSATAIAARRWRSAAALAPRPIDGEQGRRPRSAAPPRPLAKPLRRPRGATRAALDLASQT